MSKGKSNTANGAAGNGGMAPHSSKTPRAKKGAARIKGGGHKMVPGANSTTC